MSHFFKTRERASGILRPPPPEPPVTTMKPLTFALLSLALAGAVAGAETTTNPRPAMNPPSLTLGYTVLFVHDVDASLAFYEKAFGLSRRFFNDAGGKAYGELETGAARLAFISIPLARESVKQAPLVGSREGPPQGFEIALLTSDVPAAFARAVAAGAAPVAAPEAKPWGQTTACVRDNSGYLVELCTPLP